MEDSLLCITNALLCISGELISQDFYFSSSTGLITPNYYYRDEGVERLDYSGKIIAPGYLDLQSNGLGGVHFSTLGRGSVGGGGNEEGDEQRLDRVARMEVEHGVTAFWATVPTVKRERWKEVLPVLKPKCFQDGADLLGAHVEGPYLQPSKKGAHNSSYFISPEDTSPSDVYGEANLIDSVRYITLAPELPSSSALISTLRTQYPHTTISLGHSSASYEQGLSALALGATSLTHVFNAMNPLHHRSPGLAGLMAAGKTWYSIIPDGVHLAPSVVSLAFRADPSKCIFITDSIELAGLPDGTYPPNDQITSPQRKDGNRATIDGTETLIGSCITLDECVRNAVGFGACTLAEGVRCVTENVAELMGERKRGKLEIGRRADLVVLDGDGRVEETWMLGRRVWARAMGEGGE